MDFRSTVVTSMMNYDKNANFSSGMIIRLGHVIAYPVKQEQKLGNHLYDGLQGSGSYDSTMHSRSLPRPHIGCLK
jgi:hypothetical protein